MEQRSRANRATVDVAWAADDCVIRIEDGVEVVAIDVVEAGARLTRPTLGDERAEEQRFLALGSSEPVLVIAIHPRHQHAIAGSDLVEALPEEQRHADHVDEAEHRMVLCAGELVAFARPQSQRRVLAGVEELRRAYGTPPTVEHLERDVVVRVGLGVEKVANSERSVRSFDSRIRGDAVAHRRCRVVVDRAEVALTVDERVAQRERLRHAHERVVDRGVAVRVVLAHHVADRRRGLLVRPVRLQAGLVHAVEHAAVHRLQPVAHIRQGARDDDRHRVVEEARAHLLLELARLDAAATQRSGLQLRHGAP